MNALSLCSGYGGLSLAVERVLGCETVAYAEIEKAPAAVFARHWPDIPNLGDITAVDWTAWRGVDVIEAGFPCQDLSYAGRGAGIREGTRSGLWYAIEDALGVVRPRLVVLENVAAIVARRPGLDVVLAGLARLEFDAEWTCLRASDVGAPHGRLRWFLVAHHPDRLAGSQGRPLQGRPGAVGQPGSVQRVVRSDRAPATDAQRGRVQRRGERRVLAGTPGPDEGASRERQRDGNTAGDGGAAAADADCGDRRGRTTARRVPSALGTRDQAPAWGTYAAAVHRWEHTPGRPAPAPTDDRGRLSPAFVEWLMGLPVGWVTDTPGLSRAQQLKCLGNGVVPQQAEAALRTLLDVRAVAA